MLPVVVSLVDEPSWLLVRVDRQTALEGVGEPGFELQSEADEIVYFDADDAGAVVVEADGQNLGRLGASGEDTSHL